MCAICTATDPSVFLAIDAIVAATWSRIGRLIGRAYLTVIRRQIGPARVPASEVLAALRRRP